MAVMLTCPVPARQHAPCHETVAASAGETYVSGAVEPLSDGSTKQADFFNILHIEEDRLHHDDTLTPSIPYQQQRKRQSWDELGHHN